LRFFNRARARPRSVKAAGERGAERRERARARLGIGDWGGGIRRQTDANRSILEAGSNKGNSKQFRFPLTLTLALTLIEHDYETTFRTDRAREQPGGFRRGGIV
jgi:hypothetical protein